MIYRSLDYLVTVAGAEAVAAAADVIFAFGTSAVDTMDVEEHETVTVVRLAYNLEQAIAEVALGLPWLFMILLQQFGTHWLR